MQPPEKARVRRVNPTVLPRLAWGLPPWTAAARLPGGGAGRRDGLVVSSSGAGKRFEALVATMHTLRAPGGCPWDAEQTHTSLKPYVIEEAHEVCDAIDSGDDGALADELGDVLLQVVFHAELAAERRAFAVDDVIERLNAKLVRRHPHVFAGATAETSADVLSNWSKIKREERNSEDERTEANGSTARSGALGGIPRTMPALLRAHRLGERAAAVGFDWRNAGGVRDKVREELEELAAAESDTIPERVLEEIGDALFTLGSYARHCGANAEMILHAALDRFQARFEHMEAELSADGLRMEDLDEMSLDAAWQRAKRR
jgi:tetrapyrrole methylase family protein/MazG family protein